MGQNQTNPFREGGQIMNDYQIQYRNPQLFLTFLQHKHTHKEYILRELTFNELRQFTMQLQKLQKRKQLNHPNLTNLQIVEDRTEDQMCSNFFKIYSLWEYPSKCLMDDIAARTLQNKPYTTVELWTLIESCTNGLAYLQEKGYGHECLTSKIILYDENNNIKVADPSSYGLTTNLQYVLSNRYNKSIYLSPQQCESIKFQRPIINKNIYKNDVYCLALIILQAGLLEKQDKCYLQDCTAISQTVLTKNIARLGEKYGPLHKTIVEIMTNQNIENRPDWVQLQKTIQQTKTNKKLLTKAQNNASIKTGSTNLPQQRPLPKYISGNNGQVLPLPTILSVSNEGESSIRQHSTIYNNTSHIPVNFVTSNNTNQFKSQVQPLDYTNSNPNFLPVYSNLPKSPSGQGTINFKYSSSSPQKVSHPPIDMTATFGSGRNAPLPSNEPRRQFQLSSQPVTTFRKLNNSQQIPLPSSNKPLVIQTNRVNNFMGGNTYRSNQQILSPRSVQNRNIIRQPPLQYPDNEPVYIEQRFAKGSRYEGYKLRGMRHGQGKFFYQDGGRYEGEWKENKMNGYGKLFYQSDKIAYEGEWVNDQFHGWGKLYNENPVPLSQGFDYRNFDEIQDFWDYYQGYFIEDLKNGKGKLRFSNGQLFQGTFADDMVQGQGVFSCKDGQVVYAVWMENHLVQMLN